MDTVIPGIRAIENDMVALRHHIHAHPELAYEEVDTSKLVAERLASWGYRVHRGLGGTGVVGTLTRGQAGKAIGLRADMDALPIHEATGLPYASQYPGKMHACGHDGHTAILLAAAQHLAQAGQFDGSLHLIFQPAEEGGRRTLQALSLRRDFCTAQHARVSDGTVWVQAGLVHGLVRHGQHHHHWAGWPWFGAAPVGRPCGGLSPHHPGAAKHRVAQC